MRFIADGPPPIDKITYTDDAGIMVRSLCTVDGSPAEIRHNIAKRQEDGNGHNLNVFDARRLMWVRILTWDFDDVGHVPIHPEADTKAFLRELSERMWSMGNTIVAQSRVRQDELDIGRFAAERMEHQRQLDLYLHTRDVIGREEVVRQSIEDDFPTVDNGELVVGSDLRPVADAVIPVNEQEAEVSE